jgi:hypothetical protein
LKRKLKNVEDVIKGIVLLNVNKPTGKNTKKYVGATPEKAF